MTHTEQIIKDAIEGGWKGAPKVSCVECGCYSKHSAEGIQEMFLDPSFWQAVGRQRGWDKGVQVTCQHCKEPIWGDLSWKEKQHQFIEKLQNGDDYETALSKLV